MYRGKSYKSEPYYSMGERLRSRTLQNNPGPGTYTIPSSLSKHARSSSFGSKYSFIKKYDTPGPGTYEKPKFGSKDYRSQWPKDGRFYLKVKEGPGPGTYDFSPFGKKMFINTGFGCLNSPSFPFLKGTRFAGPKKALNCSYNVPSSIGSRPPYTFSKNMKRRPNSLI